MTSPTPHTTSAGPSPSHSRPTKAIGAMWSCSKPSQPSRASRWTRNASCHAWWPCTTTNGLEARNAATASTPDTASLRHCFQPATTSGTSRNTPGYLKPVARPTAMPASSSRPDTSNASETATPRVSGTSVTAACEYATWIVQTATTAAATTPAAGVPKARRPSHQVAAIADVARTTPTIRAVRYDGSFCHAWNGALTYI